MIPAWPRAGGRARHAVFLLILSFVLALSRPAAAQSPTQAPPPLAAELSVRRIEVTTAFTGGEILVYGATERLIGPDGDHVVVLASGPPGSMVVREKINVLGFWINGAAARFNRIPSYWALASTRPVDELVVPEERRELRLGMDQIPLPQLGARGPQFREALRELKQHDGLWVDQGQPIQVTGGRLFAVRLPLPATVATGPYRVEVMLVRDGHVVARQDLALEVARVGTAASIADVARTQPVMYALACILLAAFAGWLGSVLFRRG